MATPTTSSLAKRAEAAQTPAQVTPQQHLKHEMNRYKPVILRLLDGTGVSVDTFVAQVANAVRNDRNLLGCTTETLLGAALRCAQLGMAPNDGRNLCWIIGYGGVAQFQLGYGGVIELARRALPGMHIEGRAVYPNDDFDLDWGNDKPLLHRSHIIKKVERGGDAYAWYVRVRFPDGQHYVHVLDHEGVEYHRAFSKQPKGKMWTDSYDAAALKSVVLDMRRWLPSSPQLALALAADDRVVDVRTIDTESDDDYVDDAVLVEPEPVEPVVPTVQAPSGGIGRVDEYGTPVDTKETTKS